MWCDVVWCDVMWCDVAGLWRSYVAIYLSLLIYVFFFFLRCAFSSSYLSVVYLLHSDRQSLLGGKGVAVFVRIQTDRWTDRQQHDHNNRDKRQREKGNAVRKTQERRKQGRERRDQQRSLLLVVVSEENPPAVWFSFLNSKFQIPNSKLLLLYY